MRTRWATTLLAAALALPAVAAADETTAPAGAPTDAVWEADFDVAAARAKKEGKDLLVDFTGSDWCGWCIRLHKEVFVHDEFLAPAGKQFVLVALDFPNAEAVKAKVPNPARNQELAQKYGIQGYPTVLLMTADGDVYGQTGYQQGGAVKYAEHVQSLRAEGLPALKESRALADTIRTATGKERADACAKAIAALEALEPGSGQVVPRKAPVLAAFAADRENKEGTGAKAALALLKAGAADAEVVGAAAGWDPKNASGLLERVIEARGGMMASLDDVKAWVKSCDDLFAMEGSPRDPQVARRLATGAMFCNHQHLKDAAAAVAWAKRRQGMGFGEDEDRIKALCEKILAGEEKAEPQR